MVVEQCMDKVLVFGNMEIGTLERAHFDFHEI